MIGSAWHAQSPTCPTPQPWLTAQRPHLITCAPLANRHNRGCVTPRHHCHVSCGFTQLSQLITRNAHIAISGAHRTPPQPWLSHSALSPPQQWLICITLPAGHSHSAQRAPLTPLPWRSHALAGLSVSGGLADLARAGIALDDGHACSRVITGLDTSLPLANGTIGIVLGGLVLRTIAIR